MPFGLMHYGIHPLEGQDGRKLTDGKGMLSFMPKFVRIPLPENTGIRISVSEGEEVMLGQVIGAPASDDAVAVHASVSGRVVSIGLHETPEGPALCATIENNRRSRPAAGLPRRTRLGGADVAQSMTPGDICRMMREAGTVRMDGSASPLHLDFLQADPDTPVDYVLIDACESEPYVTCVHSQLRENAIQAVAAARLLARAAGRAIPVLCLPDDRPAAIQALRIAVEGTDVRISVLRNIYPLGGERTLVRAALGTDIPAGGRASDVGAIVVPAATAFALHDAAKSGMPVIRRVVTVSGRVGDPHNVMVPFGTPIGELIAFCGGMSHNSDRIIAGGPMTGRVIQSLETPVTAATCAILALPEPAEPEKVCIRCGACIRACPERLMPSLIDETLLDDRLADTHGLHPEVCTGCGACSYACPAKRRLAPRIYEAGLALLSSMQERGAE